MKLKKELDPKVVKLKDNKYQIHIWYGNYRYRFSTGKPIGVDLNPNQLEVSKREVTATLLQAAYRVSISQNWRPAKPDKKQAESTAVPTIVQIAKTTLDRKLSQEYSQSYKQDLKRTYGLWIKYCTANSLSNTPVSELDIRQVRDFIEFYSPSNRSKRNLKRNISSLIKDEAEEYGVILNLKRIIIPKTTEQLHRPIRDVKALLEDIESYNANLHLCCLMTYSMLLRPHREIRCLRFDDFNDEFTQLSLGGDRVKSKRNRVLPVPEQVRILVTNRYLRSNQRDANLFSLSDAVHNRDYFKGLWSKYKSNSSILEREQTLYSFRHTGAIQVFEKTGSLQKLQQVMGHSDMKVSLTYLRGLEVKQLDINDLPEL